MPQPCVVGIQLRIIPPMWDNSELEGKVEVDMMHDGGVVVVVVVVVVVENNELAVV